MSYFSILNLPSPPSELLEFISSSIVDAPMQKISGRKIIQLDGAEAEDAVYNRWSLDQKYVDYVAQLIPELANIKFNVGFQSIKNVTGNLCQLHPHTDGVVRGPFCIHYMINVGGDDVKTIWWKQHDEPTVREPWKHVWNLAELEELDSTVFPEGQWNIMRTDIIHSVQSISTDRVALAIGFFDETVFNTIKEKYSS